MPDEYSAKGLIELLRRGPLRGKRYLIPKGDLAGDDVTRALRGSDAVADEVIVYRTVKPEDRNLEPLRRALKNKEIDAITFFSPSSLRNFSESVSADIVGDTVVACIGPSTEKEAAGFSVVISAKEATVESIDRIAHQLFRKLLISSWHLRIT